MASANVYANLYDQAFSGKVNYAADSIKMALLTSTYVPNLATHTFFSDLTNEVSGTGYTAGGLALTTKTHTVTAANSWATVWAATTAYTALTSVVKPLISNGYIYQCLTSGTSGSSAPAWPIVQGQTVTDGTAVWTCMGESITQWSSAAVTWSNSTITARYGVIYDAQTGVTTTEPLMWLINFVTDQTSAAGPLTVNVPTLGWSFVTPQ